MKVKLYKKFVSKVCRDLGLSRKQLFSRDYEDCVLPQYKYDIPAKSLKRDSSTLSLITHRSPLSQLWNAYDFRARWLLQYWKHSHWKHLIQVRLDLGEDFDSILVDILNSKQSK